MTWINRSVDDSIAIQDISIQDISINDFHHRYRDGGFTWGVFVRTIKTDRWMVVLCWENSIADRGGELPSYWNIYEKTD
jgi:hypothetical protein